MAKCKSCGAHVPFFAEMCDECTRVEISKEQRYADQQRNRAADAASSSIGEPAPVAPVSGIPPRRADLAGAIFLGFVGAILGAFVGYLLRPPVPLVGQLPFGTVITRGANLRGVDQLLLGVAHSSFNYLLVGATICALIASVGYYWSTARRNGRQEIDTGISDPHASGRGSVPLERHATADLTPPMTVRLGDTRAEVENLLGTPGKMVDLGTKVVYVYSDLKIIFSDGKVSDVQ